jgi:beta-galactosidase
VAWDQIPLPAPATDTASSPPDNIQFRQVEGDWTAAAHGTRATVDGKTGLVKSLQAGGTELLAAPLAPNFWRACTDNDNGWKVPKLMGAWKDATARSQLQSLGLETTNELSHLVARLKIPVGNSRAQASYALLADGRLRVKFVLEPDPKAPELPRVGMTLAVPAGLNRVQWFGRGPQENYWDRKTGAAIGIHHSAIDQFITPYVRPQENANRCDVRWIQFAGQKKTKLRIEAVNQPFGVSAWPYSAADLMAATHDHQLPRRNFITVNVDAIQMGVGGDNSWGLPVHKEYRIPNGERQEFTFDLRP